MQSFRLFEYSARFTIVSVTHQTNPEAPIPIGSSDVYCFVTSNVEPNTKNCWNSRDILQPSPGVRPLRELHQLNLAQKVARISMGSDKKYTSIVKESPSEP